MTSIKKDDNVDDDKKQSLYATYSDLLVKYPLLVNGTQSSAITGLGVFTSQIIVGNINKVSQQYDFTEVKIMMLISFIFITPILLSFYKLLNNLTVGNLGKLIIDQFLFSPVFTFGILSLRLYLLGENISDIPAIVLKVLPSVMITAWMYWIPIRFIMLTYIPPTLQLLVNSGFGFIWNIVFAIVLSK